MDSVWIFVRDRAYMNPLADNYQGCVSHCVNLSNDNVAYPICYWQFGDGNTSNSCNPYHCYTTPGTYYPILTIIDGFNCSYSDTMDIPIEVFPTLQTSTLVTNASCYDTCDGIVSASSVGGLPPYQYLWSNATVDSIIVGLCPGTYTSYTQDAAGCRDTVSTNVIEPSKVQVSHLIDDFICDTGGWAYGSASGGNGAPYSFFWLPTNVSQDSILALPDNSPYRLVANDIRGCPSDTITFNVVPFAPMSSNILVNPQDSICPGDQVVLNVTATGGNPAYSFLWNPGGNTNNNVLFEPEASGYYDVTISDNCGETIKDSVYIFVRQAPFVDPIADIYSGCPPLCVDLSNSAPPGGTCFWDFGDGDTSNLCNITHCFQSPGIYNPSLAITDIYGCTGTALTDIAIEVYTPSPANFTTTPSQIEAYIHTNIKFFDVTPNSVFNEWYIVNDSLDTVFTRFNDPSPIYSFERGTTYTVVLITTDDNGCMDTTARPFSVRDLNYIYVPNTFTPNGNGDNEMFMPSIVGDYDFNRYSFMVFNRWGQLIFQTEQYGEAWDGTFKGLMSKEDSYVWKVEVALLYEDRKEILTGHVNLLK